MHSWVMPYEVPEFLQAKNGLKFGSKIFTEMCTYLDSRLLKTTAYNRQTNGWKIKYHKTLAMQLCQYLNERQDDWDA